MNRITITFVGICVLLATAHRLPAPIVEEATPTPSKQKRASNMPETKSKSSQTKTASQHKQASPFAGCWAGEAKVHIINGDAWEGDVTSYIITISDDEKIAWTKLQTASGKWAVTHSPVVREGGTLIWSYRGAGNGITATFTFRMQIAGGRSASLRRSSILTGGEHAGGTTEAIGILTKQ